MVVDTSVILGLLFAETHAGWAADVLNTHAGELRMSTVNLADTLILLGDRQAHLAESLETALLDAGIRFVAPDVDQARCATEARLRYRLDLGDCFAYALAVAEDCPIITSDDDFRRTDRPVMMPASM